jgi:hypothetical protein
VLQRLVQAIRRWLAGLVVLALTTSAAPGVSASPINRAEPCGRIDLRYQPNHVPPGQMMGMQFTIWNCSEMNETLDVGSRPTGPCRFLVPMEASYTLEPGMALTQISDFFAPQCPGQYRVRVELFFEGTRLDVDRAWFVVHQNG